MSSTKFGSSEISMTMNYMLLFIFLLSCSAPESHGLPSLANTKWEYKVAEGCISYMAFANDSTYENYDCEKNYPYSGKYEMKGDTVYLIEIDLASNVPAENEKSNNKKIVTCRCKLIYKEGALQYVSWEAFENNKWLEPVFPSGEILYKKTR